MVIIQNILFAVLPFLFSTISAAQINIKGKVYDETGIRPMEQVSVLSGSGTGTTTGVTGYFELTVSPDDSIWFSYLGKATAKFAVSDITTIKDFTISLGVPALVLPNVSVAGRNYKFDSIENRQLYQKVFNYEKPSLRSVVSSVSLTGIAINIHELIRLFQFQEKRKMISFKNRLLAEEQQKFINRHFNKRKIKEVVQIDDSEIDRFILLYSPDFSFVLTATEYNMKKYIKDSFEKYKQKE